MISEIKTSGATDGGLQEARHPHDGEYAEQGVR